MSTGRLTWRNERWSRGSIVEELPRFRARYGGGIAAATETARSLLADELDQPRAQDVRRTLRAIIERGGEVPLGDLDRETKCELMRQSYRLFGTEHFERLPDEGLRQCASAALEEFERSGGPTSTDGEALRLVASLLRLWRQREAVELKRVKDRRQRRGQSVHSEEQRRLDKIALNQARLRMLRFALRAAGIKAGPKNVERLVTEAGKVL